MRCVCRDGAELLGMQEVLQKASSVGGCVLVMTVVRQFMTSNCMRGFTRQGDY